MKEKFDMEAGKFLLVFVFFAAVATAEMRTNDSFKSVTTEESNVVHNKEDKRNSGMTRKELDCGPGDLHGPSATIESPYNPGYYHIYFDCWWTMHVPANMTVRLEFERFDLYTGHDYVTVYDGPKDVTGKLTGLIHVPYFVDITGDTMMVEYKTDISFTTNGFKATFHEIDKVQDLQLPTMDNPLPVDDDYSEQCLFSSLGALEFKSPTTVMNSAAPHNSSDMYVSSVTVACYPDSWDVRIYLPDLYKRYSDFDPTDIYLGVSGCEGYRSGDFLIIQQPYTSCKTHLMTTPDTMEYTNTLVYAYRDAEYKFIVRDYRFRIDVECDMATHETVSQHFIETHNKMRTRSNNPHVSGSGHFNIHMSFYSDSSYLQQMTGSPLLVNIGDDVYVSVTTPLSDKDVKMRVESCYTLPSPSAGYQFKFNLIINGCSSDVNTRVIHKSSHETRLVFRDFEYSTNQDNLYLFCSATFCNVTDLSSACDQSCHKVKRRSVQSATEVTYLRRAETSDVLHLSKGRLRRDVGKLDDTDPSGHAQYISVHDHLFIAVIISAVGISVVGIFVAIRRYRKPKSKTNENI